MAIIYKITNKLNNNAYIGATVGTLESIWDKHKTRASDQNNVQLIDIAMREGGINNFIIEMLEEHPDGDHVFNVLRGKYIEEHKTYGNDGYNTPFGYDGWIGMKSKNKKKYTVLSEETKNKISESNRGRVPWNKGLECPQMGNTRRGISYTEEEKKRFSECHKGSRHSEETKKKIKDNKSETYVIENPSGEILKITNLSEFCKEKNISQGNLTHFGHTKNYKLLKSVKKVRTYTIENIITKETFIVDNLRAFCVQRGIANAGLLSKYKINKPYMNWKILSINYSQKESA